MSNKVRLSFGEKLEVVQYLQLLESGKLTADRVLAELNSELEFTVKRSHLVSIAKDVGFKMARKTPQRRITDSWTRHSILAKALLDIARTLNVSMREDLQRDVERIAENQTLDNGDSDASDK